MSPHSPKQNIKLTLAYDGTFYLGWQKTRMGKSIEETLQKSLEQILQEPITLQAASRTDAGVHAQGQVANFFTSKASLSYARLRYSLNRLLPPDIRILNVEATPTEFHPTLHCQGKSYHYSLYLGKAQLPHLRHYSWHCPYPLDLLAMKQAAQLFLGKKDFSSLCNIKKNHNYKNYIRELKRIELVSKDNLIRIEIEGDHFLYKMARNIVGTLVYIGRGKLLIEEIPQILSSKDRTLAGITAPAHGLSLYRVHYFDALN